MKKAKLFAGITLLSGVALTLAACGKSESHSDESKTASKTNKKLLVTQDWGKLYHNHKDQTYNPNDLQAEIDQLMLDDEVTKNGGIVPYVLSDETARLGVTL